MLPRHAIRMVLSALCTTPGVVLTVLGDARAVMLGSLITVVGGLGLLDALCSWVGWRLWVRAKSRSQAGPPPLRLADAPTLAVPPLRAAAPAAAASSPARGRHRRRAA